MESFADILTKIRNAQAVNKNMVSIEFSNFKYNFMKVLERSGFVGDVRKRGKDRKRILIDLKYKEGKSVINEIKMISKPSRHMYLKKKKLYLPKKGRGVLIVSTSKGIITSKEAMKEKIGGEMICEIW